MTRTELLMGGVVAVLAVLGILVSILRLAQANPLQQLRGLLGLISVVGMVILVISVAIIFHNVRSKLGPTNGPNVGYPTQTTNPSFSGSGEFATPSVPPIVR